MAHRDLTIERTDEDGNAVLAVHGELAVDTTALLTSAIDGALRAPETDGLCLDLSDVTFLDSYGLRALIQGSRSATDDGNRFWLRHPSAPVSRILTMTGVGDVIEVE
jgi:anti-anti-sigma factor